MMGIRTPCVTGYALPSHRFTHSQHVPDSGLYGTYRHHRSDR